jgi:uncharacterized protein YcfJ
MSYSIMDMGNSTKAQSKGSLKTLADMEQNREMTNDSLKQQKKGNQMSGAATGATMGFMVGGPYGAAIGGAIGLIGGSL